MTVKHSKDEGERLTAKQRQVLEAMAIGLYLRRKNFSSLWEIARSPHDAIVTTTSRSSAAFTVNRLVVEDLKARGFIKAGLREGRATTELLITDAGTAAIVDRG